MPYVPSPRRASDSDVGAWGSSTTAPAPTSIAFLRRPQRPPVDDSEDVSLLKHNTTLNSSLGSGEEVPQSPIHSAASSTHALPYSVPLVRKKSGEVLKSSIRLNMLLNSSASVPTTPTSKQVHFGADIDVRYFDEHDKPASLSAPTSPFLSDDSDSDEGIEIPPKLHLFSKTPSGPVESSSDDAPTMNSERGSYLDRLARASRAAAQRNPTPKAIQRFKRAIDPWVIDKTLLPPPCYTDNIDAEAPLFLERCFLSIEKTKVIGQVAVKNMAFSKSVTVRYTYNNWASAINIDASYTPDIPRNLRKNGYDRFAFQLPLQTILSQFFSANDLSQPRIQFCINLKANGMEFWDNNHNKNYTLGFVYAPSPAEPVPHPQNSPLAMHTRYMLAQSSPHGSSGHMIGGSPGPGSGSGSADLKKSKSFSQSLSKSFSTSDLANLPDLDISLKENDNFASPINDSPLRLSIDSLKRTSMGYLNSAPQSVPLTRPEHGSQIKRSNEGTLEKLALRFDEIKANRIHIPHSDMAALNLTTQNVYPLPEPEPLSPNYTPHHPHHHHHPVNHEQHSPTIINPNQRDSHTYRNLVQKYCFYEPEGGEVDGKEAPRTQGPTEPEAVEKTEVQDTPVFGPQVPPTAYPMDHDYSFGAFY